MFPSAMRLKSETAEEITDCATPDGIRRSRMPSRGNYAILTVAIQKKIMAIVSRL